MNETKFSLTCPVGWKHEGCKKEHVLLDGNSTTLCGRNLQRRRFDTAGESGDISNQESINNLSNRGVLSRHVCFTCLKKLIKLGKEYNVEVNPKTLII